MTRGWTPGTWPPSAMTILCLLSGPGRAGSWGTGGVGRCSWQACTPAAGGCPPGSPVGGLAPGFALLQAAFHHPIDPGKWTAGL